MEFAGVKPEQLGRVKVTSVSECFLAEKEWQTVTRRGAVLAWCRHTDGAQNRSRAAYAGKKQVGASTAAGKGQGVAGGKR